MITTKQMKELQLTHKHAGNGWAMIADLDKEYCQVVSAYKPGPQVYLAAKDRLEAGDVLPEGTLPQLTEIRTGITSGKLKVEKNRVVKA